MKVKCQILMDCEKALNQLSRKITALFSLKLRIRELFVIYLLVTEVV